MTRLLRTLCFFLMPFALITAQDFSLIPDQQIQYFERESDAFMEAISIDSVVVNATDSSYFFHRSPFNKDQSTNCPLEAGWTGLSMILQDSLRYYQNVLGDSILIMPFKDLNSQWSMYQFIEGPEIIAEVIEISLQTILGQEQLVKKVELNLMLEEEIIDHPINGNELLIAEKSGWLRLPAFREFPSEIEFYTRKDYEPMRLRDLFDYKPGDEVHYQNREGSFTELLALKILDRTETDDTIKYEAELRVLNDGEQLLYTPTLTYTQLDEVVNDLLNLGVIRSSIIIKTESSEDLSFYEEGLSNQERRRLRTFKDRYFFVEGQDCFLLNNGGFEVCTYLAGVGVFCRAVDFSKGIDSETTLLYYKKGNETFGQPIYTSIHSADKQWQFRFYPNPAREQLFIELGDLPKTHAIEIFDAYGRIIQTIIPDGSSSSYTLDLSQWNPGIYWFHYQGNTQSFIKTD